MPQKNKLVTKRYQKVALQSVVLNVLSFTPRSKKKKGGGFTKDLPNSRSIPALQPPTLRLLTWRVSEKTGAEKLYYLHQLCISWLVLVLETLKRGCGSEN
jgi:hypothetical protein